MTNSTAKAYIWSSPSHETPIPDLRGLLSLYELNWVCGADNSPPDFGVGRDTRLLEIKEHSEGRKPGYYRIRRHQTH